MKTRVFGIGIGVAWLAVAGWNLPALGAAPAASTAPAVTVTAEQTKAVGKGLEWLAKQQKQDGSFGDAATLSTAVTGLTGIAFLAAGAEPGKGAYGGTVEKAIDSLLKVQDEGGVFAPPKDSAVMYQHGFAMVFLARAYPLVPEGDRKTKLKAALEKGIAATIKAQNKEGGWRYTATPNDADVSVTAAQLIALHAAKMAGLEVDEKVLAKGVKYVRGLQNPDGGFSYTAGGGGSAWPRSAAAVAVLEYAGLGQDKQTLDGLKFLAAHEAKKDDVHQFYAAYYLAHAMKLAPDGAWQKSYEALRQTLVQGQDKEGTWNGDAGQEYATALALIVLQMPEGKLK